MEKVKEIWAQIKEIWKTPRGNALIQIILIILFFIIIIIIFNKPATSRNIESSSHNSLLNYSNMKSYEFSYYENKDNQNTSFNGWNYKNSNLVYLNNNKYYIKDKKAYLIQNDISTLSSINTQMLKLTPQKIYNLISDITPTTTKKKKIYSISMYDFMTLYNPVLAAIDTPVDLSITKDNQILITMYQKDNKIYKVELDITNYNKLINNLTTSDIITIQYTNINTVNDFRSDFNTIVKDSD